MKTVKRVFRQVNNICHFPAMNRIVEQYDLDQMSFPTWIEIETVNRCNGHCKFCPVNAEEPQREYAKMTEELYHKIIGDLEAVDYQGGIALYSNNEPFLDERLIEFQTYGKTHLPKARWTLFTNGTLLTLKKFEAIIPYLDELIIDNYNNDNEINPTLKPVHDMIMTNPAYQKKVKFWMRSETEVLASRGGNAPNRKKISKIYAKVKCDKPFRDLVIRPTGKISLCCCDALGEYTLGDVNVNTIEEIWKSEQYYRVRETLQKVGRSGLKLCRNCDHFQMP